MALNAAAAVLALASLMPGQGSARPVPSDLTASNLPVSISRIRQALKRPPSRLLAPKIEADFRVEILERQRFRDLLDLLNFDSGPIAPGGFYSYQQQQVTGQRTQPLFNIGLSGVGQSIGAAVGKARRERAERLAREEVRRALVDFCSAHECQVP